MHNCNTKWIIEELKNHGYEISPGTLYPILHNLKKLGLVLGAFALAATYFGSGFVFGLGGRHIQMD